jgi:hypothetical protein
MDGTRLIDPLELERELNPVHFPRTRTEGLEVRETSSSLGGLNASMISDKNVTSGRTVAVDPSESIAIPQESASIPASSTKCAASSCLTIDNTFSPDESEESTNQLFEASIRRSSIRDQQCFDESLYAIPSISPSVGECSDDTDMAEPVTPLTDSSAFDLQMSSKRHDNSFEFRIPDTDEGCASEDISAYGIYATSSDLNGNVAPGTHDLQVLQANCELFTNEKLKHTDASSTCTLSPLHGVGLNSERTLSTSASLDEMPAASVTPIEGKNAEMNQDSSAVMVDILLSSSPSTIPSTLLCAQCPLAFSTRGKLK